MNVDQTTAAALGRWKVHQAGEQLAFGPAYAYGGWVVAEADGSLVQPDTLSSRWKQIERLAGVRSIGLHDARHSTPRWPSRRVLAWTLFRASDTRLSPITADVYGHPEEDALKEAARKMGTDLGEGQR